MLYSVFGARKFIGQPTARVVVANSHACVRLDVWICISVLLQIECPIWSSHAQKFPIRSVSSWFQVESFYTNFIISFYRFSICRPRALPLTHRLPQVFFRWAWPKETTKNC